ncbi:MAG: hypothetical protein LBK46_06395 [Oscillospiraceae bacterium]|nr:hypothetical protein [Oscillospiraceae bacterium]
MLGGTTARPSASQVPAAVGMAMPAFSQRSLKAGGVTLRQFRNSFAVVNHQLRKNRTPVADGVAHFSITCIMIKYSCFSSASSLTNAPFVLVACEAGG